MDLYIHDLYMHVNSVAQVARILKQYSYF